MRSHVVLENLTPDEVATTTVRGVSPISIAAVAGDLTDSLRRQAVAAYRIADDDAVLVWQRRVRQQEAGLKASINLADLTTVIHADGRYRARAVYNIRNFTLQFLELALPLDSQVWSVHVAGQPVRPAKIDRQGRPVTLLPLQKTSVGDFSSKVVMIYSGHLGEPLRRWTEIRPTAPQILSDVPVSRTLWTLLLPREYEISLVKDESNLEEVGAAYQREERKLSFLDELRQIVQVARSKGGSAAQEKARDNLKQVDAALYEYAQQSAEVDAAIAADVQEQAQQIAADIQQLPGLEAATARAGGDTADYFRPPGRRPDEVDVGVDLDWSIEDLDLDTMDEDEAESEEAEMDLPDQADGRPEERRGKLREQAAEQLMKLQQEGRTREETPGQQQTLGLPDAQLDAGAVGLPPEMDERTGEPVLPVGQSELRAPSAVAGAGYLSLDMDLALVGSPHHFRKLHGDPRIVLRARHEDLTHLLSAVVWAGLCLGLAAAAIGVLRRPNAAAVASRYWPWLAAVIGTAWLFLLPWGALGLLLLVIALCVWVARTCKPRGRGARDRSATAQAGRVPTE
jgi:hypothetical protein